MALITNFVCLKCRENRHEVVTYTGVCAECRGREASQKRRMHFAALKGLTVEERLDKIEEHLYDLSIARAAHPRGPTGP